MLRSLVRFRSSAPLYWIALAAALVAALAPLVPLAVGDELELGDFSAARAMAHIEIVAVEPHPMGSAANLLVRDYIVDRLADLGLEPELQHVDGVSDYYSNSGGTVPVANVIAKIPGDGSTGAVALMAHYDSAPRTPGANDNGSGVAVLLETARIIVADAPLRNDVILVFTDGEEPAPRFGSEAFIDGHPLAAKVGFVINLESLGGAGPSMLVQTSGPQSWVLDRYVESAPQPVAYSFVTQTTDLIGGSNTDFAPFRDVGVAGIEAAYIIGSPIYHTAADSPGSVNGRSLNSHGANTLGLVRDVADRDLSALDGDDTVFFTVGRYQMVRYPTRWTIPLTVAAGLVLLSVARRRHEDWRAASRDGLTTLIGVLLVSLVTTLCWTAIANWRDAMTIAESYAYLVGFAVLVFAAGSVEKRRRHVRASPLGQLMLWWALALACGLLAPGFSYLFLLPVVLGAVALAAPTADDGWKRIGTAGLTIGVALIVLVPAIDFFFQFAQPRPGNTDSQVLPTVVVPVFIVSLLGRLALAFRTHIGDGVTSGTSSPTIVEQQALNSIAGVRVGTLVGVLLGAATVALTGVASFWIVVGCGAVGGSVGYWIERLRAAPT